MSIRYHAHIVRGKKGFRKFLTESNDFFKELKDCTNYHQKFLFSTHEKYVAKFQCRELNALKSWFHLKGVLPNDLNAFLDFCTTTRYFTMDQFCQEVNRFQYDDGELNSKSQLDLTLSDLTKQNNLGMLLTSMQIFHLFVNLPFILKLLLRSSHFPQNQAILICVDILSLCFANTINITTPDQLRYCIKKQ